MTREMQKLVKRSKQMAAELIKYANPKSINKPSIESITEILLGHIPYNGEKPVIVSFDVMDYHKNDFMKTAHFRVETASGKAFKITVYQNLKGRTPEEREADKTATFPSELFNIFHDEITQAKGEPTEEELKVKVIEKELGLNSPEEMLTLLNILEAHGETLEDIANFTSHAIDNIFKSDITRKDIVQALMECNVFFDGELANTVTYVGNHEKAGITEFSYNGNVYRVA